VSDFSAPVGLIAAMLRVQGELAAMTSAATAAFRAWGAATVATCEQRIGQYAFEPVNAHAADDIVLSRALFTLGLFAGGLVLM
jgi:hypothetical protein